MYTRCPACLTVFRIGSADLRAADGQVVCGRCDAQFNALDSLSESPDTAGTRVTPGRPLTAESEAAVPDLSQTGAEPHWDRTASGPAAWREGGSPFGEASSGDIPPVAVPEAGEGAWREAAAGGSGAGEPAASASSAEAETTGFQPLPHPGEAPGEDASVHPFSGQGTEDGVRRLDEVSAGDDLEDTDSFEWPQSESTPEPTDRESADHETTDQSLPMSSMGDATTAHAMEESPRRSTDQPTDALPDTAKAADLDKTGESPTVPEAGAGEGDEPAEADADHEPADAPGLSACAEGEATPAVAAEHDDAELTLPAGAAHPDADATDARGSPSLADATPADAPTHGSADTGPGAAPGTDADDDGDLEAALEAELNALADQAAEEWAVATGSSLPEPGSPDQLSEAADQADEEPVDVDLDDPELDAPGEQAAGESPEDQAVGLQLGRLDPHGTETVVLDGRVSLDELAADVTDAEDTVASAADGADGVDIDVGDASDETLPGKNQADDAVDVAGAVHDDVEDEIEDSSLEFNVPEDRWDEIFAGDQSGTESMPASAKESAAADFPEADATTALAETASAGTPPDESMADESMATEEVVYDASPNADADIPGAQGSETRSDDDSRPFPSEELAGGERAQDWPLPARDIGEDDAIPYASGEARTLPVGTEGSDADASGRRHVLWMAAAVFLAATLVGQWIHAHRASLLTHPRIGTVLSSVYDALGIGVEPAWQLDAFRIEESAGVQDPANPGTLRLSLRFTNAARFPQPYPLLRVTLEDRWGEAVAKRDFTPAEYAAVTADRVPAGGGTEGRVTIVDPGPTADGYRLDLCYATDGGDAYCLGDLPGR